MNTDIFEGKSKEMRGRLKGWWGKLTDDDLERVGGNVDQIIGLIQQKYGYTRQYAKDEFNQRIKSMETSKQRFQGKIPHEVGKVKKYFISLEEDGTAQFRKFENNVSQAAGKAKNGLTTWVEDGAAHLSDGLEHLTDDAKDSMHDTAVIVKKGVNRGLKQYNSKAQEVANQVPGNFGKRAAKYPWVTISVALLLGFLLGNLLKPTHHYMDSTIPF